MAAPPLAISVTVSQRDLDRITKRLDKWQGKPLADRVQKAMQLGLRMFLPALKVGAARHNRTGDTMRGYGVRKLRFRPGQAEIAAYKVSSNTWYKHFAIVGTSRGVQADPYVDQVRETLGSAVASYINEQVRRLA